MVAHLKEDASEICSGVGLHQGTLSPKVQHAVDKAEPLRPLRLPLGEGAGGCLPAAGHHHVHAASLDVIIAPSDTFPHSMYLLVIKAAL